MRPSRSTLLPAVVAVALLNGAGAALAAPGPTPVPAVGPAATTYVVQGAILARYQSLGGARGFLGRPLSNELTTPNPAGRYSVFEGGSIYWTAATGAWEVHGAIFEDWAALGWENGRLGFPLTNETATPERLGAFSAFERGAVYWSPDTGVAAEIEGAIRERWADIGWENSPLGFPITDELDSGPPEGRGNAFEFGTVEWTPRMGALITSLLHWPSRLDREDNRFQVSDAKQSFDYDNNDTFYRVTDPQSVDHPEISLADFEAGLSTEKLVYVFDYLQDPAHRTEFYLFDLPEQTGRAAGKTLLQQRSAGLTR